MNLNDFHTFDFPKSSEVVYVIGVAQMQAFYPFYVGSSKQQHIGRCIANYTSAQFSASTDFKVGKAIRFFQAKGYQVQIKYKQTSDSKAEEKAQINELRKTYSLLNGKFGYDYTKDSAERIEMRIGKFVEEYVERFFPET